MVPSSKRVALVTGASSGIGRSAATALVGAGFAVAGTSRDASRTAPIAGVTFIDLDVTDDAVVARPGEPDRSRLRVITVASKSGRRIREVRNRS